MRVILLGPPGAGKGTQCENIVQRYDIRHLSSGDILRGERAAGSELGKKAQSYMDSGALVPDDLIIEMMIKAIKSAEKGYILDGFPRTVVQAEALDKALDAAGEKVDAIVNLEVDDEVIIERLTGRRIAPKSGRVYHIKYNPPKEDNKCDETGEELIQREDDKPEVVKNRLKTYHDQTEPVLGYYRNTGKNIIDVRADQDIEKVTSSIFDELDKVDK